MGDQGEVGVSGLQAGRHLDIDLHLATLWGFHTGHLLMRILVILIVLIIMTRNGGTDSRTRRRKHDPLLSSNPCS